MGFLGSCTQDNSGLERARGPGEEGTQGAHPQACGPGKGVSERECHRRRRVPLRANSTGLCLCSKYSVLFLRSPSDSQDCRHVLLSNVTVSELTRQRRDNTVLPRTVCPQHCPTPVTVLPLGCRVSGNEQTATRSRRTVLEISLTPQQTNGPVGQRGKQQLGRRLGPPGLRFPRQRASTVIKEGCCSEVIFSQKGSYKGNIGS